MAASRLARHLPSLFGPSRRAAWRLSLVRRGLSAGALLLALHLALGTAHPPPERESGPSRPPGPTLTLPLAAPADHLSPGDRVGVYLPGRSDPVVRGARVVGTPEDPAGGDTVSLAVPAGEVGPVLREMGAGRGTGAGSGTGFVLVGLEGD